LQRRTQPTENETDNYSIAYGSFVPLLVKGMQEQQVQIESQALVIENQTQQINSLQMSLDTMLAQMELMKVQVAGLMEKIPD